MSAPFQPKHSGLLVITMTVALLSCSTLPKKEVVTLEQIRLQLEQKNCPQLKEWARNKNIHPHDYLNIKYHQLCDSTQAMDLKNPHWYAPSLHQIKNQNALSTPEIHDDLEVWLEQARLSKVKRDKETNYLKIINAAPDSDIAKKAQEALWKLSPRLSPQAEQIDPLVLAKDYREALEHNKALEIINHFLSADLSLEKKLSGLEEKRQVLRSLQNKKAQLATTKEIYQLRSLEFQKKPEDTASYLATALLYGRAVWTDNNPREAREIFKDAAKKLNGKINLSELYWVLGKLEDEQKNTQAAISFFESSLNEPESSFTLRALWSAGWLHYKQGEYKKARELFERLTLKDNTENRARFWAARCLQKLHQEDAAQQEFVALSALDPLGYYGILAQRELKAPFIPIKTNGRAQLSNDSVLIDKLGKWNWYEIQSFLQLATSDEAAYALDILTSNTKELTTQELYELSKLYALGKLYLPLFAQIQKLSPDIRNTLLSDHPELLFPIDYREDVYKWAQEKKVPPEFVFSIIRQESTFNPLARSPVDALGLMQMMPKVAAKKAKELNIPYKDSHDLFLPQVNIALGTDELADLLKQYSGSYILASAGYNASHIAIKGWLKQRFREDPLEFIEEVGYDETRFYIKLVLRNFIFYKRILNAQQFTFPEELLKVQ